MSRLAKRSIVCGPQRSSGEPAEQRCPKAVGVLQQGRDPGQIVRADVLFARAPDRLEGETSGKLGLEELKREALELGVGRAAGHVLAPREAADGGLGDNAAHDEHTAQVVEEDAEASAPEQVRDCRNECGDAVELAKCGAGVQEPLGQGASKLEPPAGVSNNG